MADPYLKPVSATIASIVTPRDPDGTVLAAACRYTATLHLDSGNLPDCPIGRPIMEIHAPPLHVHPLAVGTRIMGFASNGTYFWFYVERPLVDQECTG